MSQKGLFVGAIERSPYESLAQLSQGAKVPGVITLARRFADLVRKGSVNRDKAPADPLTVFRS